MYQQYYTGGSTGTTTQTADTMSLNDLDTMLNRETEQNKTQGWNKLDKTLKVKKLNEYADRYGETNNYNEEQTQTLKQFLRDCLDKSKLKNTKDVYYNKDTKEVTNIPTLSLNATTHNFTLRNTEATTGKKTVRNVPGRNTTVKERVGVVSDDVGETTV
jgi:hypothetical protein